MYIIWKKEKYKPIEDYNMSCKNCDLWHDAGCPPKCPKEMETICKNKSWVFKKYD